VLAAGSPALAEADDPIEHIRDLIRSFEYADAVAQAESIAGDGTASAARRLDALALSGVVHLLQRHQDRARQAFEQVLGLDPGYRLNDPDLPPRVVAFFDEVRQAAGPGAPVTIAVDAPAEGSLPGGEVAVRATIAGPTEGVDRVVLNVREGGETRYRQIEMEGDGAEYAASLGPEAPANGFEIYVEVFAPSGTLLASEGSSDEPVFVEPLTAPVTQDPVEDRAPSRRWYTTWWFWTIVGVVVAGATVGIVVGTLPEEQQDGTLGSVQMPLR
jgi:hypothetical protein